MSWVPDYGFRVLRPYGFQLLFGCSFPGAVKDSLCKEGFSCAFAYWSSGTRLAGWKSQGTTSQDLGHHLDDLSWAFKRQIVLISPTLDPRPSRP